MEIFYSPNTDNQICMLDVEESTHCIKVLRHKVGDEISIIDGTGALYTTRIIEGSNKGVTAEIISTVLDFGKHNYHLTMAVAPTKNIDRYEWFAEKACELGIDRVVPIICKHSERKIIKTHRIHKLLISATKQSLKSYIPSIDEATPIKDFILEYGRDTDLAPDNKQRFIAFCFDDERPEFIRKPITSLLNSHTGNEVIIMIGPEGDFSKEEVELALSKGFTPIHLGTSRLRTETAALTAVEAVYLKHI